MNLFSRKKRLYIRKENSTIDRKYEQEKNMWNLKEMWNNPY